MSHGVSRASSYTFPGLTEQRDLAASVPLLVAVLSQTGMDPIRASGTAPKRELRMLPGCGRSAARGIAE
jgi:hypothetical protein